MAQPKRRRESSVDRRLGCGGAKETRNTKNATTEKRERARLSVNTSETKRDCLLLLLLLRLAIVAELPFCNPCPV